MEDWAETEISVDPAHRFYFQAIALRRVSNELDIGFFIPKPDKAHQPAFWDASATSATPTVPVHIGGPAEAVGQARDVCLKLQLVKRRQALAPHSYKQISMNLMANDKENKKTFESVHSVVLSLDDAHNAIYLVGAKDDVHKAIEEIQKHSESQHRENVKTLSAFGVWLLQAKYPDKNQFENSCAPAKIKLLSAGRQAGNENTQLTQKKIALAGTDAQVKAAKLKIDEDLKQLNQLCKFVPHFTV